MSRAPVETAPDQVARILALVPYLLSRGEVRLEAAAQHFGVTPEQLDKDLRLLFMTGVSPGLPGDLIEVDIDALEGDGIIRVGNADYLARPVRFAPSEATALIVALRTMLDGADEQVRPVLQRTLTKLEQAAGQEATASLPLHVDERPPDGAEHVAVIEAAITRGVQAEIDYYVPSRDRHEPRVVDPRALARIENVVYLDAWCHSAGADRVFRLDRILSARTLDVPVTDQAQRPRDLTARWFAEDEVPSVTLRLGPEAFWVSEYFPIRGRQDAPGGQIDVELPVASQAWLLRLLMRLSPHARVLSPSEHAAAHASMLGRTLNLYRSQG